MTRRAFLPALIALALAAAAPASAQDAEARLRALLAEQGYVVIRVERTLLGRLQLWAERGSIRREIVINRVSGEILRDYRHTEPNAGATAGGRN